MQRWSVVIRGWLLAKMVLGSHAYFFANDSVLFCRAIEVECQKILDILAVYERGSGQKINSE